MEILNPNASSEKMKYFDNEGKTTFKNLAGLFSQDYVVRLKEELMIF